MTIPWAAGQTPYVTPDQLYAPGENESLSQWPTGCQWGSIPGISATPAQTQAALTMLCRQGTTRAESCLNQPLRCTLSTETLEGPQFRVTVQWRSRNARILTSRWPVLAVTSVEVAPNAGWPRSWTSLPSGYFEPEFPIQGLYGTNTAIPGEGAQSILAAPGYVNWLLGREGFRVRFTYYAGWPHTCLTADASVAADSISVDDITGFAVATPNTAATTAATIYDATGGGLEAVTVTAATPVTDGALSGPGTLTLASSTAFPHQAGLMVSSLPEDAIWATALFTADAALRRGATATTVPSTGGRQVSGRGHCEDAKHILAALRRTI